MKKYIAGLLTGIMLVSVPIAASELWDQIDVIRNSIIVKVDGETVDNDNFVYNDTTYMPLRAIAEMLGKQVTYVEGENTAYIGEVPSKVLARVGNDVITENDLLAFAYNANVVPFPLEQPMSLEEKQVILTTLTNMLAVNQYAASNGFGLSGTDLESVNAQISMQKDNESAMLQNHMTFSSYKKLTLAFSQYDSFRRLISDVIATDEAVTAYYESHKDTYINDTFTSKHILINTTDENGVDLSEDKMNEAKKQAESIYQRIVKGEDFDKLMNEFSQDPGLAQNPDGYTFSKGESVAEYEDTALALKDGEVAKPVKSQFGYHIIKLISINNDVLPMDQVRSQIVQSIFNQQYPEFEANLIKDYTVTVDQDALNALEVK